MVSNNNKKVSNMMTETSVETHIFNGVSSIVNKNKSGEWIGTMTELNTRLVSVLGKKTARVLPGSPSALRVALNRVVSRLRAGGVSVKFTRDSSHTRNRLVQFSR